MILSTLRIENFRMFGQGEEGLMVVLRPGLTALVGENDEGKSAVIDALRLALGTRDQEFFRVEEADFHQPKNGEARRQEIRICCKFDDLSARDASAFAEYLTYEDCDVSGGKKPTLYVHWRASAVSRPAQSRRYTLTEVRSGAAGDGPQLDVEARTLLRATYLRPLRDAERALSAGRGSRLSQILQHTKEINEGSPYDPAAEQDPADLSVVGIADLANALLRDHRAIEKARQRLNSEYLDKLSFNDDSLQSSISVSGAQSDEGLRLRQLLEKLELELRDVGAQEPPPCRGLGSNNLLFIACELLLLGSDEDGLPLLLVEEPEAHLHPQRQLRLIEFLQQRADHAAEGSEKIQVIVTTHSPNLASAIDTENVVLLRSGKAFSLASECTALDRSDYGFLRRFLDVTKANMFFARGVLIVEGDAEAILLPTLARLIGRDLTASGVSIVNVGGTGLRRFARIYQRSDPRREGLINVPVACVTDLDVMPECAPEILDRVKSGEPWPEKAARRWRARRDFADDSELQRRRDEIRGRASGQLVETFVANFWTLESDLAYFGLAEEVWIAGTLARADDAVASRETSVFRVARAAIAEFGRLRAEVADREAVASHVFALFVGGGRASKAIAAQYLARILESRRRRYALEDFRALLPPYLVGAIDYVTRVPDLLQQQQATNHAGV